MFQSSTQTCSRRNSTFVGARFVTIRHPPSWHQPSSANDSNHNEISISIATHLLPHRPLNSSFFNPSWRETAAKILFVHAIVLAAGRAKRHVSPFMRTHALPICHAILIPTADRQGLRSSYRSLHFLPVSPALVLAGTKVSVVVVFVCLRRASVREKSDECHRHGLDDRCGSIRSRTEQK